MGNWLWPPGYPFFLATLLDWFGTGGIFAAKLIQVLGSGVIGLVLMLIARRTLDHRAAIVAGLIWCFYLPLIGFSHYLWPETIFLVCFVPALYLLVSWSSNVTSNDASAVPRVLGAGLLLGASLLIKESVLYLSAILVMLMIWRFRRVALLQGIRYATLFALAQTAVVLPWTLRNYEVYDRSAPVATSLGQNCFRGIFGRYVNIDLPTALIGTDEVGDAPLPDPDGEPLEARVYGRDHWIYRWFIHRPPEAVWRPARRKERDPDARVVMNTVDQSKKNVRKAIEFVRQYPRYFALLRVKRLSNWASPTSFFVRHNALGMSRHRAAIEPVLIIAAAGFLSRIGRRKGVSKLAAASIAITWAAPQPTELFAADLFGGEMDGTIGCHFQCVRETFAAYRACIDKGGTREECRMTFQTTYENCIATCEPTCQEMCFAAAQDFYRDCIEGGGTRRECGRMAFEFLMDCLEGCDP